MKVNVKRTHVEVWCYEMGLAESLAIYLIGKYIDFQYGSNGCWIRYHKIHHEVVSRFLQV